MKWWVARSGRRVDVQVVRASGGLEVTVDGATLAVELIPVSPNLAALLLGDGRSYSVAYRRLAPDSYRISLGDREFEVRLRNPLERELAARAGAAAGPQDVRAPIPGKVVRVAVEVDDEVAAGQVLVVLEAMKMENQICAEGPGRVSAVLVAGGATVEGGQTLVTMR